MNTSRRFRTYIVFGLTALLTLSVIYFAYAHYDLDSDSDSDTKADASCSATAVHYHYRHSSHYNNLQWAGFSASLGKKHNIGYSVDGKYNIYAYVTGGPGSGREKKDFTLTVGGIKILGKTIIKWGDSKMGNKSDSDSSYTPATSGSASAKSSVGSASTKTCRT